MSAVGETSMVVFVCDLCALFLSGKRKKSDFLKGKMYLLKGGIFVYCTVVFLFNEIKAYT